MLRRWSEVLAVAQQLGEMNPSPARAGMSNPGRPIDTSAHANGFDIGKAPNVLPFRPQKDTRTATWLQKWWSLAFPAGGARKGETVSNAQDMNRFLLWVDAVGGYLVCTGDEIVLGQPVPGSEVDVPIRGDLSRRHAVIHRDGEGYLLEAVRDVHINRKLVERATSLKDGDRLTLGESVELCFRRPHPLSQTARLDFVSYHRTQPATDAVLLLSDSCILGPGASSHVVCPAWPHDVVLYRQGADLACRSPKPFKVDGAEFRQRGPLAERSQVAGQDFSFSVEPA